MFSAAPVPSSIALAFDSTRERTVLFGGRFNFSDIRNETHAYAAPAASASAIPYGAGCAGPTGVPTLAIQGVAPRLGATVPILLGNLPTGFLNLPMMWIGFDDATWNGAPLPASLAPIGFPGCLALLAPEIAYGLTNNGGWASQTIQIPFLPTLDGEQFFAQGRVLVLGFNPGGVVFSNGVRFTIGG